MDQMMPEMNGIEATHHIRGLGYNRPIVAFTAALSEQEQKEILNEGCFDAILTKPINVVLMDTLLNKYICSKEIQGVSMETGLGLYEGDMQILTYAYRSYVKNVPAVVEKLRNLSEDNLAEYATNVHAIRGNSASIGADEFAQKAAEIEKMAKSGDFEGVLKENASLVSDAEKLLESINEWLSKV
jgi:CheY-like chemotaxis protein